LYKTFTNLKKHKALFFFKKGKTYNVLEEYYHYGCAAIVSDSAALRVAIDIETLSAFLYLLQVTTRSAAQYVCDVHRAQY